MGDYVQGLVSVVMPTYKRSEKLIRAIESVLSQTYCNLELLLINDNDPDDVYTEDLKKKVEKYSNDSRFYLVMQDKHVNGAVARNVGIKRAKGEYIAFLDDDDWWEANKLEKQVEVLQNLPSEWGGISCRIARYRDTTLIAQLPKYRDGLVYKDILLLQSDFATGTLLLRHSCLDQTGYFDETLLRHQDLQLLVCFTFRFKLFQLDELLHCCDVSDAQNRPDGEKLLKHKEKFFKSVEYVMDTLTNAEKRRIYCIHSFEVGYVFFKNRQIGKSVRYFAKVLASPKATYFSIKKVVGILASKNAIR